MYGKDVICYEIDFLLIINNLFVEYVYVEL